MKSVKFQTVDEFERFNPDDEVLGIYYKELNEVIHQMNDQDFNLFNPEEFIHEWNLKLFEKYDYLMLNENNELLGVNNNVSIPIKSYFFEFTY